MLTDSQLRDKIMRRVWAIYLIRQLMSPTLRLGVLGVTVVFLSSSVSLKSIVENALATEGFRDFMRYILTAFVGTETWVQILVVLLLALATWLIADGARTLLTARTLQTER